MSSPQDSSSTTASSIGRQPVTPHHEIAEAHSRNPPAYREEEALVTVVEDMKDRGEGAEETEDKDTKLQNTRETELPCQKQNSKARPTT